MRTESEVAAMQCPVCRVPLAMSDRQGIEIDYCPQCRGVWLDRGELDKIVERSAPAGTSASASAPRPAPSYAQHGGQQHSGYGHGQNQGFGAKPHKRKKSFFEEIFD